MRDWAVGLGLGVLALLVLWVLFAPSGSVEAPLPVSRPAWPPTSESGGSIDRAPSTAALPVDVDEILRDREVAEKLAEEFSGLLTRLEKRGIDHWNPGALDALEAEHERAVSEFTKRRYREARERRTTAIETLNRLHTEADGFRVRGLTEGQKALERGEASKAKDSFDLVLAVEPGNARAEHGLQRARTLDEVKGLVREGEFREHGRDLEGATQLFEKALALDGETVAASAGLERVGEAIAERDYRLWMSGVLEALERGEVEVARKALRQAAALRPGRPEVADGLARASTIVQGRAVRSLREEASALEARESWSEALASYREVLEIDETLGFAQGGQARTARRATLAQGLSKLIADPERLNAPAVQTVADRLLDEARVIDDPGPVLRGQVSSVERLLVVVRTPVVVQFQSDRQTDVLLFKVGRLGQFDFRELRLTPGRYTAVGKRPGFRDVRIEFGVQAGSQGVDPIIIRCEDAV